MGGLVLGRLCTCRFEVDVCRFMGLDFCYLQEACLPVILSVDAKDEFSRAAIAAKLILHPFRLITSSSYFEFIGQND